MGTRYIILAFTLALASITGCVKIAEPLKRNDAIQSLLEHTPVIVAFRSSSGLFINAPWPNLSQMFGGKHNRTLSETLDIRDPVLGVKKHFMETLEKEFRFQGAHIGSGKRNELQEYLRDRDYSPVFWIGTAAWNMNHDLTFSNYRLYYEVHAGVVPALSVTSGAGDFSSPYVVWRESCSNTTGFDYTMEEWSANKGKLLKDEVAKAEAKCGRELANRFLTFLAKG